MRKKSHEEYTEEVRIKRPNISVLGIYKNTHATILHKCECGNEWMASPCTILAGGKCRKCAFNGINKIFTYDFVKGYLNNLGFDLIDDTYKNVDHKLTLTDKEGYLYYTTFYSIKLKSSPEKFYTSNPYTLQNIKLWLKLNNKQIELISNIYENADVKLQWKCLKSECQEVFMASWKHIIGSCGCPFCAGVQVGLSNCLATKRPDLASEWHPIKNGDLTPYSVTCNSEKRIWWKCNKCDHEWITGIHNRHRETGCPLCNISKGEAKILNYLNLNIVNYTTQKQFVNLLGVGGGNLSYDFYLPDYNLLIEYQGKQHEQYIVGFHTSIIEFEKQQEHDKRKRMFAIDNQLILLEIWYCDFERVEEILDSYFKIEQCTI